MPSLSLSQLFSFIDSRSNLASKLSGLRLVQCPPTPIISCSFQEEISLQRERHVNWLPPGPSLFRQQKTVYVNR